VAKTGIDQRIATVNPGTLLRLLELRWRRAATKKAIRAYDSG
jgi:hypothetical protein